MSAIKKWHNEINEIANCIQRGMEAWVEAGEIIAKMLDEDPSAVDTIAREIPGLTKEILFTFERIGRRELHPSLLINNSPGVKRLAQVSYSQQERYVNNPMPVIVCVDGGYDTLQIKCEDLTPQQCAQVFDRGVIRDDGAQRAYIEAEKKKAIMEGIPTEYLPYHVTKGKATFRKGCILTKREVKNMLAVM